MPTKTARKQKVPHPKGTVPTFPQQVYYLTAETRRYWRAIITEEEYLQSVKSFFFQTCRSQSEADDMFAEFKIYFNAVKADLK